MSSTALVSATTILSAAASATTTKIESYYSGPLPNLAFNTAMTVIFALFTFYHLIVGIYTKQIWFSVTFICGSILETIGYIGRALSHASGPQDQFFIMQMVCLTLAPVFTMAAIYYQLAKLIEIYGFEFSTLPTPMSYSYVFIVCDVISLVIQALGGGVASMAVQAGKEVDTGDNIFIAGLSIQVVSMTIFIVLWFCFLYGIYIKTRARYLNVSPMKWKALFKVTQEEIDFLYRPKYAMIRDGRRWSFHYFNLALTASLLFVYVRCCYRVAELAEGWDGYIISHEVYFIILDALMMSLAYMSLTIFHPGIAFMGRSINIPITKSRKNVKNHKEEEKISTDNIDDEQKSD